MSRPPQLPLVPSPLRWLVVGAVAALIFVWSVVTAPPAAAASAIEGLVAALPTAESVTTAGPYARGALSAGEPVISPSSLSRSPYLDAVGLTLTDSGAMAPSSTSSSVPAGRPASTGADVDVSPSAVRHFLAYATLSVALAYALVERSTPIRRKAALVFALATSYGALVEVAQLFRPERVGSLEDLAINAIGATVGLGWYLLEEHVQFVRVFDRHRD